MKTSMGLKKGDLLTDSLEAFWGRGGATKVEAPRVDTTPRDIITPTENISVGMQQKVMAPQEAYTEYGQAGETVKDIVEQQVSETQDLTPNVRAAAEYSRVAPVGMVAQRQQRNPFDIGGFDEMIQKQLSRERGSYNIGMGNFGMGPQQRLSGPEKMAKDVAEFRFGAMKKSYADEQQYKRLAMMDIARQSQAKMAASRAITESYKQAALRERAQAGLPVYESPWDVIAGGKRIVSKKDKEGNTTTEIERYGGLFGAVKETSKAFGEAKLKVGSYFDKRKEKELLDEINETIGSGKKNESTGNKFVITVPQEKKEKTLNDFIDKSYTYAEEKQSEDFGKFVNESVAEINKEKPAKEQTFKYQRDLRDV